MNQAYLDELELKVGKHNKCEDGVCLIGAVSVYRGGPFTDHDPTVSPLLAEWGRSLNDALPDDRRQELKPLVPLLIGTSGDGQEEARAYLFVNMTFRELIPQGLQALATIFEKANESDMAKTLIGHAEKFRALPTLDSKVARALALDLALDKSHDDVWTLMIETYKMSVSLGK